MHLYVDKIKKSDNMHSLFKKFLSKKYVAMFKI